MSIKTIQLGNASAEGVYAIADLPLAGEIETRAILKKTKEAARALGELKGVAISIPNETILINTLSLQEAKDSSAIENIITTHDELYKSDADAQQFVTHASKEVYNYAHALKSGYAIVKERKLLLNSDIKYIQQLLEGNDAGFRSQSGTALKNEQTGEIIYTPPQHLSEIQNLMKNLEAFINDDELCDWDDLVKMAVIHHQFESIHPFFDGNGRTGRIINILYMVKQELLRTPILYLSRYINQNKSEYYRLLQHVRDAGVWEEWILFMLEGVKVTSYQTITLIEQIKTLMARYKHVIREEAPKIYSQDLLNIIFTHPYTKTIHIEEEMQISRPTATKYLDILVDLNLMEKMKLGRENYYINHGLYQCLKNAHQNM